MSGGKMWKATKGLLCKLVTIFNFSGHDLVAIKRGLFYFQTPLIKNITPDKIAKADRRKCSDLLYHLVSLRILEHVIGQQSAGFHIVTNNVCQPVLAIVVIVGFIPAQFIDDCQLL